MDVAQEIRAGRLQVAGSIRVNGTLLRRDGTRSTSRPAAVRKGERRRRNKAARAARKGR